MKRKNVFQLGGSEKREYESVSLVVCHLKEQDIVTESGEEKEQRESGGEWIIAWK